MAHEVLPPDAHDEQRIVAEEADLLVQDRDGDDETSSDQPQVDSELDHAVDESELVPVWLAAVVLVLLLAVVGVGGYIVGKGLHDKEQSESAVEFEVEQAREALAADPDNLEKVLALGFAYQQAGRYQEAIAEYDRVLHDSPQNTAALYNKGVILLEMDPKAAEETLWDVLEVQPAHVLAAKTLGEYYASRGEYRSLVVAVKPAADENESAADLQYLMGLAYENTGHPDWAESRYRLALKYVPDMVEAKNGLDRLGVRQ